jgi:PAS domain S-box-containing protein
MVQQVSLPRGPTPSGPADTDGSAKGSDQEPTVADEPSDRLSQIVAQERSDEQLWTSIYQNAWEESQDAQIVFNKTGKVFRANRKARLLLRCSQKQLSGKAVEDLIPERFRTVHKYHSDNYVNDPAPRFMGVAANLDLWLLTADGDELQVEISLSPLESEYGLFINAVIRRKRGK